MHNFVTDYLCALFKDFLDFCVFEYSISWE